jgi:hypothetical protein
VTLNSKLNHFSIKIPRWQPANHGDYIEYIIEVTYLEGGGAKWTIEKRYSDFVDLDEQMKDFFSRKNLNNALMIVPELPP